MAEIIDDLPNGWVNIVHKEAGLTSKVIEAAVPGWETAGWTRADNGSEESGRQQLSPPPPPPPGGKPSDKNEE